MRPHPGVHGFQAENGLPGELAGPFQQLLWYDLVPQAQVNVGLGVNKGTIEEKSLHPVTPHDKPNQLVKAVGGDTVGAVDVLTHIIGARGHENIVGHEPCLRVEAAPIVDGSDHRYGYANERVEDMRLIHPLPVVGAAVGVAPPALRQGIFLVRLVHKVLVDDSDDKTFILRFTLHTACPARTPPDRFGKRTLYAQRPAVWYRKIIFCNRSRFLSS